MSKYKHFLGEHAPRPPRVLRLWHWPVPSERALYFDTKSSSSNLSDNPGSHRVVEGTSIHVPPYYREESRDLLENFKSTTALRAWSVGLPQTICTQTTQAPQPRINCNKCTVNKIMHPIVSQRLPSTNACQT